MPAARAASDRLLVRAALVAAGPFAAAALALWVLPRDSFDLHIFLQAGDAVRHGHHPHPTALQLRNGAAFVYPLPAAWVFAPLSSLHPDTARTLYAFACAAAVAGGLWILGVRTFWVAAAVGLSAFMLRALTLGTVEPLLFLLMALTWRVRDRQIACGAVLGAAVVLKPVVALVWLFLILTRRWAATAVCAGVVAGLWILTTGISPAAVGHYTSTLHDLSRFEARKSLSTMRLIADLRISPDTATAIVAVAGISVLLAIALRARRRGGDGADRAIFATALIVGIGISPIVWSQYFLLAFVALIVLGVPRIWILVLWLASWFITPDRVWVVSLSHYIGWPRPSMSIWLAQAGLLLVLAAAVVLADGRRGYV